MVLSETVSIDAGTVALVLLALAGVVVVFIVGFVAAPAAGRGSRVALAFWIPAVALEGLLSLGSLYSLLQGAINAFVLAPLVLLAAQVILFVQAGKKRPR